MRKILLFVCCFFLVASAMAQTNLALPAGTALKVKLENTLATYSSKHGDAFSGRVTEPVMLDGKAVIPIGATVQGRITKVSEPRRIAGKPTIGILPEVVVLPNGERYNLNATLVDTSLRGRTDVNEEGQFKGEGHDGQDIKEIGVGTGGGMLLGGLIGGGKGTLIGGAVGATVTVVHWLSGRRSAVIPAGTELVMELNRPMAMTSEAGQ